LGQEIGLTFRKDLGMGRLTVIFLSSLLVLLVLPGCLQQKESTSPDNFSSFKKASDVSDGSAATPDPLGLNTIRDPASENTSRSIDCAVACPDPPGLICSVPTPTPDESPTPEPSPTPDGSPTPVPSPTPAAAVALTVTEGLQTLLPPPVNPKELEVIKDHAGNLIFMMRSEDALSGDKEIYYAVLKPNNTTIAWQSLNITDADEFAISTSAVSYKIHVVARVGVTLEHCIFEVGSVCAANEWQPIGISMMDVANARDVFTAIKSDTLNLVEVPGFGIVLGMLGLPDNSDPIQSNPLNPASGYYMLTTIYTEKAMPTIGWQKTWYQENGTDWIKDLNMTYFPVSHDMTSMDNEVISELVFMSILETTGNHINYEYTENWFIRTNTIGGVVTPSWMTNFHLRQSLDVGLPASDIDEAKSIEDIIYQRGTPGYDVFAINDDDNLLHIWTRGLNGVGGKRFNIEVDPGPDLQLVSAVYAQSLEKIFVAAIEDDVSILYKSVPGHHEAVNDDNKLEPIDWRTIPGDYSLLDTVDTPNGVVGIYFGSVSAQQALRFFLCDESAVCTVVEAPVATP
jgi:hypothetical protein